jgi:peptide/nickel transport system substrate-binding protein
MATPSSRSIRWPERAALCAGTLCALALCGCGAGASAASRPPPGEIRVAIPSDILGTDPGVKRDSTTDSVLHHVVESLVAYREDGSVAPLLAQSVRISADGATYSFALREGVSFHNGRPLTAADVKWSWQRMLEPSTGFRCRGWYDGSGGTRIASIETPDERSVVFRLEEPSGVFLANMASVQCVTAILHRDSTGPDGSWSRPIGTGPYSLAEWRRGEYVRLERFAGYRPREEPRDGYAGGREAHARSIRWLVVPDPAVAKTALLAGSLDLVEALSPIDVAELESSPGVALHMGETFSWKVLLVNKQEPLLHDVRLRRALVHALDLDALARELSEGAGRANPSAVPRRSRYHTVAHDAGHAYDPALSRRLAAEAGYRGQTIKLQTNRRFPDEFGGAVYVQALLRRAGFEVELEVLDWATQLDNYYKGRYQLQYFGFTPRTDPTLNYGLVVSTGAAPELAHFVRTPEAARLLAKSAVVSEAARRQALFDRLHRIALEDVPVIGLFNPVKVDATSRRIEGYEASSLAKPRLWGVRIRG